MHSRGAEANPGGFDQIQCGEAVHSTVSVVAIWRGRYARQGVQPRLLTGPHKASLPLVTEQPLEPKADLSRVPTDAILRVETSPRLQSESFDCMGTLSL